MDCDVIDFRIYEIKCDKTASKRLCGQEQVCLRKTLRLLVLDGPWKGRGGLCRSGQHCVNPATGSVVGPRRPSLQEDTRGCGGCAHG